MSNYGYWADPLFLDQIVTSLKKNRVVAGTSDTVPGLLAPLTAAGKSALDAIKIRESKPYLVLVGSVKQAAEFSDSFNDPILQQLTDAYWPGPLTIVVPAASHVLDYICAAERTIALRVPEHTGLLNLLGEFDGLFSTSANFSGKPVPDSVAAIDPIIKQQVDLLVDDRQPKKNPPSTIVAYRDGQLTVLRPGSIKI